MCFEIISARSIRELAILPGTCLAPGSGSCQVLRVNMPCGFHNWQISDWSTTIVACTNL